MNDSQVGSKMINVIDMIGFTGPLILLLVGILMLWSNKYFWCAYLVIFIINILINKLAKVIIKQPRPNDGISVMNEEYTGIEMYGMP